jgi:hypothetical protein
MLPRPSRELTGVAVPAVTVCRRHRTPSPVPFQPHLWRQTVVGELPLPSGLFPGHVWRAPHRNCGRTIIGHSKGCIARAPKLVGSFLWTRGLLVIEKIFPGGLLESLILNSVKPLAYSCKIHGKSEKIIKFELNFVGFLVNNPTTFVKHFHTFAW